MHRRRELLSLEIHRQVADRLRTDPTLLVKAEGNLERWLARHGDGPLAPCYREWLAILHSSGPAEVAALISRPGEREDRLRQNSPFAGILRPQELWRIKQGGLHAPH
jgi:hypothetical protein